MRRKMFVMLSPWFVWTTKYNFKWLSVPFFQFKWLISLFFFFNHFCDVAFFCHRSTIPMWEELIVFNENFNYFIQSSPKTLLLFEVSWGTIWVSVSAQDGMLALRKAQRHPGQSLNSSPQSFPWNRIDSGLVKYRSLPPPPPPKVSLKQDQFRSGWTQIPPPPPKVFLETGPILV